MALGKPLTRECIEGLPRDSLHDLAMSTIALAHLLPLNVINRESRSSLMHRKEISKTVTGYDQDSMAVQNAQKKVERLPSKLSCPSVPAGSLACATRRI